MANNELDLLNKENQIRADKEYLELISNLLEWNGVEVQYQDENTLTLCTNVAGKNGVQKGIFASVREDVSDGAGIVRIDADEILDGSHREQTPQWDKWDAMTYNEKVDCVRDVVEDFIKEDVLLKNGLEHDSIFVLQPGMVSQIITNEKEAKNPVIVLENYEKNYKYLEELSKNKELLEVEGITISDIEKMQNYYALQENKIIQKYPEEFKVIENLSAAIERNNRYIEDIKFTKSIDEPTKDEVERATLVEPIGERANAFVDIISKIGGAPLPKELESIPAIEIPNWFENFKTWMDNAPDLIKDDVRKGFMEIKDELEDIEKQKESNSKKEKRFDKAYGFYEKIKNYSNEQFNNKDIKRRQKITDFKNYQNEEINKKLDKIEKKLESKVEKKYKENEYIYKAIAAAQGFELTEAKVNQIKHALFDQECGEYKIHGVGIDKWRENKIKEVNDFLAKKEAKYEKDAENQKHKFDKTDRIFSNIDNKISDYAKELNEKMTKAWDKAKDRWEELSQKIEQSREYLGQTK